MKTKRELESRIVKAAIAHVDKMMWETYGDPPEEEEKDETLACWCSPKHAKKLVDAVGELRNHKNYKYRWLEVTFKAVQRWYRRK